MEPFKEFRTNLSGHPVLLNTSRGELSRFGMEPGETRVLARASDGPRAVRVAGVCNEGLLWFELAEGRACQFPDIVDPRSLLKEGLFFADRTPDPSLKTLAKEFLIRHSLSGASGLRLGGLPTHRGEIWVDISANALSKYKLRHGEDVKTPHGRAFVMGSDARDCLWICEGSTPFALSPQDVRFVERGTEQNEGTEEEEEEEPDDYPLPEQVVRLGIAEGDYVVVDASSEELQRYGVQHGQGVDTDQGMGFILGVDDRDNVWVSVEDLQFPIAPTLLQEYAGTSDMWRTRSGALVWLDRTRRALERFGVDRNQVVVTPRGPGRVIGVANETLWFELDYWKGRAQAFGGIVDRHSFHARCSMIIAPSVSRTRSSIQQHDLRCEIRCLRQSLDLLEQSQGKKPVGRGSEEEEEEEPLKKKQRQE